MSVTFSMAQLAEEAVRELNQRRRVYARLVASGTLARDVATRRYAMQKQIVAVLHRLAKEEAQAPEQLALTREG